MFVGIVMSMVLVMKNICIQLGVVLVNIWCIQMKVFWIVMRKEEIVIVLQLKSGLWVKIGNIFENMLKVGKVMMQMVGWEQN